MVKATGAAVALALLLAAGAAREPGDSTQRYMLAVQPGAAPARLARVAGATLVSPTLNLWATSRATAATLVPRLRDAGALRYVEPSRKRSSLIAFSDPLSPPDLSYQLYATGADRVADPGPGFPVTILDTGLDLAHPDFAGRPNLGVLNEQRIGPVDSEEYHGTQVASAAAAPTNGVGAEGIYPSAALRVYDLGDLSDESIVAGIDAALAAGPSVINLSLGGPESSRALLEATMLAFAQGSLVVAASGNEFDTGNPVLYPAAYPHVLTVAATDRRNDPSFFSSSNFAVDLTAPGEEIPVQDPADPERYLAPSGTSFAAPIVSGGAALVRTTRGPMHVTQLFDLMRGSARDLGPVGFDERTGFGLLDLPAALARTLPLVDPQEPNEDVEQIAAGRIVARSRPPVSARFRARLDLTEDPVDVYRVFVPARRRVTVTVTPGRGDVAAALFGPTTRTVRSSGLRIGSSDRAGSAVERVSYTNKSARATVVFLRVGLGARGRLANPRYAVAVTRAAAPR